MTVTLLVSVALLPVLCPGQAASVVVHVLEEALQSLLPAVTLRGVSNTDVATEIILEIFTAISGRDFVTIK